MDYNLELWDNLSSLYCFCHSSEKNNQMYYHMKIPCKHFITAADVPSPPGTFALAPSSFLICVTLTFPTCLGFVEPCVLFQAVLSTWKLTSWLYQGHNVFFSLFLSLPILSFHVLAILSLLKISLWQQTQYFHLSDWGYISHSNVMDNFMCQLDGVKGCSVVQLFLGRCTEMPVYPRKESLSPKEVSHPSPTWPTNGFVKAAYRSHLQG